jgi:hypothetical protein
VYEEDFIADTSRDFEFAQWLYGEFNHGFLGPPGDGNIIILSDSDEEKEEVHEKFFGPEDVAASSAVNPAPTTSIGDVGAPAEKSLTPAASPVDADEYPGVEPNDSSDGLAPGLKMGEDSGGGDEVGVP